MNTFAFYICLASALIAVAFATLPPYIKTCKRNDPEINKCITNSLEQLRETLIKGIPELDVPPIEPLLLNNMRLSRGPNSASFDMNLTDINVYGPSTFKVHDFKVDVNKLIFTFNLEFDKNLEFKGQHSTNARILLLQLNGAGNVTGYFEGFIGKGYLKGRKVNKNNDTYVHFDKIKLHIRVSKVHINIGNLFNGDKVLGKATNDLLNDNGEMFMQEITPLLEKSLSDLLTDIANKITRSFTYEELFPIE